MKILIFSLFIFSINVSAGPLESPDCVKSISPKKIEMEAKGIAGSKVKVILDFTEMPKKFSWFRNTIPVLSQTVDFEFANNYTTHYTFAGVGKGQANNMLCGTERRSCYVDISNSMEAIEGFKSSVNGKNLEALNCATVILSRFQVTISEAVDRETRRKVTVPAEDKDPGTH